MKKNTTPITDPMATRKCVLLVSRDSQHKMCFLSIVFQNSLSFFKQNKGIWETLLLFFFQIFKYNTHNIIHSHHCHYLWTSTSPIYPYPTITTLYLPISPSPPISLLSISIHNYDYIYYHLLQFYNPFYDFCPTMEYKD